MQQDGILHNYVYAEDLIMNGERPWHGPRQKSPLLFNMLIEACSQPGDVVLDATAMTGDFGRLCVFILFLH